MTIREKAIAAGWRKCGDEEYTEAGQMLPTGKNDSLELWVSKEPELGLWHTIRQYDSALAEKDYIQDRLLKCLRGTKKDVKCYIDEHEELGDFPELLLILDQMETVLEDYAERKGERWIFPSR